ncbi:MAG: hypothetical protein RI937_1355, partial [Pseudomonadota bacterium]
NTVVVIEHQLDIWAQADWIIDLGPEGGAGGGKIVGQGAPAQIAKLKTHTGRALAGFLKQRSRPADSHSEINTASAESKTDLAAGRFVKETVDQHIKRLKRSK